MKICIYMCNDTCACIVSQTVPDLLAVLAQAKSGEPSLFVAVMLWDHTFLLCCNSLCC